MSMTPQRYELRQKPVRGYESAARGITYEDIGGPGMRYRENGK
jgi:transitional endoplasmic reticulum ATPase